MACHCSENVNSDENSKGIRDNRLKRSETRYTNHQVSFSHTVYMELFGPADSRCAYNINAFKARRSRIRDNHVMD